MTFRITGPGLYVNRLGEKVEVKAFDNERWPWSSHKERWTYNEEGRVYLHCPADQDIVGVWEEDNTELWENGTLGRDERYAKQVSAEEEAEMDAAIKPHTAKNWDSDLTVEDFHATEAPVSSQTLNIQEQPMYDLTRVSERFRALENGRRLKNQYGTIVDEVAESSAYRLVDPEYTWSLVPETKRVVTLEERLAAAERVVEVGQDLANNVRCNGTPDRDSIVKFLGALEAYDKVVKGEQ